AVSSPAAPATHVSPIPFMLTFNKPVTGLDLADLSVINGSAQKLAGSGTSYTFEVVPGPEGDVSVSVQAGSGGDGSGHTHPASAHVPVPFDTTAPSATDSTTATDPTNLTMIPFKVTFTEPVTGFTAAGLTVPNGQVTGFAGSGATYTFFVSQQTDGAVMV